MSAFIDRLSLLRVESESLPDGALPRGDRSGLLGRPFCVRRGDQVLSLTLMPDLERTPLPPEISPGPGALAPLFAHGGALGVRALALLHRMVAPALSPLGSGLTPSPLPPQYTIPERRQQWRHRRGYPHPNRTGRHPLMHRSRTHPPGERQFFSNPLRGPVSLARKSLVDLIGISPIVRDCRPELIFVQLGVRFHKLGTAFVCFFPGGNDFPYFKPGKSDRRPAAVPPLDEDHPGDSGCTERLLQQRDRPFRPVTLAAHLDLPADLPVQTLRNTQTVLNGSHGLPYRRIVVQCITLLGERGRGGKPVRTAGCCCAGDGPARRDAAGPDPLARVGDSRAFARPAILCIG
jgi:hypothetical protein